MKITFTDKYAPREGDQVEVTEAAGKRLLDSGFATKTGSTKATSDDKPEGKPAAKKAPAKKAPSKAKS